MIRKEDSVYTIIHAHPEVAKALQELGFVNILNPAMLNTVGKIMTLPKASVMMGISMEVIEETLARHGLSFTE